MKKVVLALAIILSTGASAETCKIGFKGGYVTRKNLTPEARARLKNKGYEITNRRNADIIIDVYAESMGSHDDYGGYEWFGNTAVLTHKKSGFRKKLFHQVKIADYDTYEANPTNQSLREAAAKASTIAEYEALISQIDHQNERILVRKGENVNNALARAKSRRLMELGRTEAEILVTPDESYGALIADKIPACEAL